MSKAVKLALMLTATALVAGCQTAPKPLYQWESYQPQVYEYFKGEPKEAQVEALERAGSLRLRHQQRREYRRILDRHCRPLRLERQHGVGGVADQPDPAIRPDRRIDGVAHPIAPAAARDRDDLTRFG